MSHRQFSSPTDILGLKWRARRTWGDEGALEFWKNSEFSIENPEAQNLGAENVWSLTQARSGEHRVETGCVCVTSGLGTASCFRTILPPTVVRRGKMFLLKPRWYRVLIHLRRQQTPPSQLGTWPDTSMGRWGATRRPKGQSYMVLPSRPPTPTTTTTTTTRLCPGLLQDSCSPTS
jgi:hypothetical protein